MAEYDTAQGEHLGQVAQAQLVAQAPEHHERDDVGRILRPVQQRAGAFVELLAAGPAAKAPVTLGGALGPLRPAFDRHSMHPIPQSALPMKGRGYPPVSEGCCCRQCSTEGSAGPLPNSMEGAYPAVAGPL